MKRILILYISNISGHKSAASAIEKAIRMLAPSAEVKGMNFFRYVAPVTEKVVNTMYMGVIKRMPIIWQVLYDNPRVVRSTSRVRRFVYLQVRKRVDKLIRSFSPDVVIATQAFPCEIVSRYKLEMGASYKVFAVLTDFAPHSFWISPAVDQYIVASPQVKDRLMNKGVEEEKIKVFGIPIDPAFYFSKDPDEIRRRLGFGPEDLILVMGGGQGLGPIKEIVSALDELDLEFGIVVVCGNNRRLYKSIDRLRRKARHKLYLFGYVENMDELMTVSKLIVTKAGGLTISEAMAKGLPMVIMNSLPGQEYNNLRFLLKNRCCVRAESGDDVVRAVRRLLTDPEYWQRLHTRALVTGRPNASLETAHLALEM